jgi:uncharacterized membrane protein YqjE
MEDPSPDVSAASASGNAGLLRALRNRLAAYIGPLQTRLQLLAVELQEEKLRVAEIGVLAAAAGFFLALAVVVFTFFLIVLFWDTHRVLVTGLIAGAYFLVGAGFALAARSRAKAPSRLFADSIAQLAKDREHLEKT